MLALFEGVLRLAGVGAADPSRASRLRYQQVPLPLLEPARREDGTPVLRTVDPRLPRQSIVAEKEPNTLRIVTFGGSATAGLGFSPNVTFARHLERMLTLAYPEHSVEVINLGIVALSSRQVKLLAEDAANRYEPDLLVIYSGNNEFLELHAAKYAAAHATPLSRAAEALRTLNLYRVVQRAVRGPPRAPSLADQNFSREDLQLTQDAIIRDIQTSPAEIAEAVDAYEANLHAMVDAAQASGSPLLLMTVASNWKWRGRSDLPEDWVEELLGEASAPSAETWRRARAALDERVADAAPAERYEWLFQRAVAAEALGDLPAARDDYRSAMNADPHLRRALDEMAERVRSVGRERGVPVFDVISALAAASAGGIVGFDHFYDYVHFTPLGALVVGVGLYEAALEAGLLPPNPQLDPASYLSERASGLAALREDPLEVGEWMGFGDDASQIRDRDLWKYDKLLNELDRKLEENPDDLRARVHRANARSFQLGRSAEAAADYRAALALEPEDARIQENLNRLMAEGL